MVLTVRFAEGRFHGHGDWPPSPARLFQAIVGGTGTSGPLADAAKRALEWLESLSSPVIAAPMAKPGQPVTAFVPRNDGDAIGSQILNVEGIRYPKVMRPQLFDESTPLLYIWIFPSKDRAQADVVCKLAANVFRLGHGIDIAWASAAILEGAPLGGLLGTYEGRVHKPAGGTGGVVLACPVRGSLQSMIASHEAGRRALSREGRTWVRTQVTRPRFARVSYNSPPISRLFELRTGESFAAWPAARAAALVTAVRRTASTRLSGLMPARVYQIRQALEGSSRPGTTGIVRVLPLASIGHQHVDGSVRRLLVAVPSDCPVRAEDIFWAFTGIESPDGAVMRPAEDRDRMLSNYGIGGPGHRAWHTVTPAALPEDAKRRRIEPTRMREEAKSAAQRSLEEMRAAAAVTRDLRLIQMHPQLESITVQREPFESNGARAEAYAEGSGFTKERLWHVGVTFKDSVVGPLVVGDGALSGLGIMAPRRRS